MHLSVKPNLKIDIHLLGAPERMTGLATVTSSLETRALVEDEVNRAEV